MTCKIISQHKAEEFQKIISIILPAVTGEMEILPGHAEAFIKLKSGEVIIKNKDRNSIPVSSGVCYIKNDEVIIIQ